MTSQCIEIVTYKVSNPVEYEQHREVARALAAKLPGFAGWLPLGSGPSPDAKADVVVWSNTAVAKAAARTVAVSPEFAGFRAGIAHVDSMEHYTAPSGGLALMQSGDGVEVGRFRLRAGVLEEDLRAAHSRMIDNHLSHQSGWLGQRLVCLEDGTFLDIAFASSQEQAKSICESWGSNAECQAFLTMIEPISMEFGVVV